MLDTFSVAVGLVLSLYLVVESVRGHGMYTRLKADLAAGVPGARLRFYRQSLVFELVSGALALLSLLTLPAAAEPSGLADLEQVRGLAALPTSSPAFWAGLLSALTVVAVASWLVARRRRAAAPSPRPRGRVLGWLLPDFSAMLPETGAEAIAFAVVALGAGVCEEIVFRGWLAPFLAHTLALRGMPLLLVAAAAFGLAHAYQGPVGVLATGYLGLFFLALTAATGSLVVPIVLHTLLDLRWALPRGRARPALPLPSPAAPGMA